MFKNLTKFINIPYPPMPEYPGMFDFGSMLPMAMTIAGLMILLFLMIYLWRKARNLPIIFIVWILSLVVGVNSLEVISMPFYPALQILFLLIQTMFFIITLSEFISETKKIKK